MVIEINMQEILNRCLLVFSIFLLLSYVLYFEFQN